MLRLNTVHSLRLRYIVGPSAIALIVTASFMTMKRVVSEQRDYSGLVNPAGHQAGLSNRIAYFVSLMATTDDNSEFNMARSQVGRTIHKMKVADDILRKGFRPVFHDQRQKKRSRIGVGFRIWND